jgi:hypothetical protein
LAVFSCYSHPQKWSLASLQLVGVRRRPRPESLLCALIPALCCQQQVEAKIRHRKMWTDDSTGTCEIGPLLENIAAVRLNGLNYLAGWTGGPLLSIFTSSRSAAFSSSSCPWPTATIMDAEVDPSYWLGICRGSKAAIAWPKRDLAEVLCEFPILALPEFPAALDWLNSKLSGDDQILNDYSVNHLRVTLNNLKHESADSFAELLAGCAKETISCHWFGPAG